MTKVIGPDVFHRLIPLSIHESASLYSEEKAKLVRQESERVDVANVELETSLSYMELPQCLSKYKETSGSSMVDLTLPPPELLSSASQIYQLEANSQPLNSLLASLRASNAAQRNTLEEVVSSLDEEFREGESLRTKYQEAWTQSPSTTAANSLRQEIRNRRELLEKAQQSDERLVSRFNAFRDAFDILKANQERDRIGAALAEGLASSHPAAEDASLVDFRREDDLAGIIKAIEGCLSRLNLLRKERADMLQDLKERTHADDISHVLILNKKSPAIEPANLLQRAGEQAALSELSSHFKKLLNVNEAQKINQSWEIANRTRDQLILRLKAAAEGYHDLRTGATAGQDFYLKMAPTIDDLATKAQRFCDTRKDERIRLEQAIAQAQSDHQFIQLQAHLNKYNHPTSDDGLAQRMQGLTFHSTPSAPPQVPFQASSLHAARFLPSNVYPPAPYASSTANDGGPNPILPPPCHSMPTTPLLSIYRPLKLYPPWPATLPVGDASSPRLSPAPSQPLQSPGGFQKPPLRVSPR
ncbi:bck1-like resistance to osmotic shock, partial [Massospora cicadina]